VACGLKRAVHDPAWHDVPVAMLVAMPDTARLAFEAARVDACVASLSDRGGWGQLASGCAALWSSALGGALPALASATRFLARRAEGGSPPWHRRAAGRLFSSLDAME
jgi:hypothetical protein